MATALFAEQLTPNFKNASHPEAKVIQQRYEN
jgi:hypothetical protein